MSLSKLLRWVLALGCLGIAPLFGQYPTSTTGTTSTSGTAPKAPTPATQATTPAPPAPSAQAAATATSAAATESKAPRHRARGMVRSKEHVCADSTRLVAILLDAQTKATISAHVWKTVGNEANMLANRIYGGTGSNKSARGAADDLRMHVRELRKSAMAEDAAGAKSHASEGLPFANKLSDWACK